MVVDGAVVLARLERGATLLAFDFAGRFWGRVPNATAAAGTLAFPRVMILSIGAKEWGKQDQNVAGDDYGTKG